MEKTFLIFLSSVVLATTVYGCGCPEFKTLYKGSPKALLYSGEGLPTCQRNATCRSSFSGTHIFTDWKSTNIPPPANAKTDSYLLIESQDEDAVTSDYFDFFETFGLICENGKWTATKHSFGISYQKTNGNLGYIPGDKLNRGDLKTTFEKFNCGSSGMDIGDD